MQLLLIRIYVRIYKKCNSLQSSIADTAKQSTKMVRYFSVVPLLYSSWYVDLNL